MNNQPAFVPIPMQIVQQGGFQQQPMFGRPPARVIAAMDLLHLFTMKTMKRCAANDVGFNELEGQQLTSQEERAQNSACSALSKYFEGNLKPDQWEQKDINTDPRSVRSEPGTFIQCFNCAPRPPQQNCPFCKGCGNVLVYPAGDQVS